MYIPKISPPPYFFIYRGFLESNSFLLRKHNYKYEKLFTTIFKFLLNDVKFSNEGLKVVFDESEGNLIDGKGMKNAIQRIIFATEVLIKFKIFKTIHSIFL